MSDERALERAWHHIKANARFSLSEQVKNEIKTFDSQASANLKAIRSDLRSGHFIFERQRGVLLDPRGKKRPIVIAPVANRVVQRSILEVLKKRPRIDAILRSKTSFGGIDGQGREEAIRRCCKLIDDGFHQFVGSDIAKFYTKIPRRTVLDLISRQIPSRPFAELCANATITELANLAELGEDARRFPGPEEGVAQGSCLSTLLGNLLLHEFDVELNTPDVACLRYIDDFLILARTKANARLAFARAELLLEKHGLTAYRPGDDSHKASQGNVKNGVEFLGCEIRLNSVRPNRKSRKRILDKIHEQVDAATEELAARRIGNLHKTNGLTHHLWKIDNTVRGWGNAYQFCNADDSIFQTLDEQIDGLIAMLLGRYSTLRRQTDSLSTRRLLGVQALRDLERRPIYKRRERQSTSVDPAAGR
ncbi:MAG: hypothetical protein JNL66_06495 [Alphaproteobacteria bacterium]|nr:hypothetical protein [Alphaproteobacteria bacterium]